MTAVLLLLVSLSAPDSACAQDGDAWRFLRWTYQDVGAAVQKLHVKVAPAVLTGGVLLVSTAPFDPPVLEGVQRGYRGPLATYLNLTNELGGDYVRPAMACAFAASLLTENERLQDAAFTSLQSLVYAGAVTKALKNVFGRHRPYVGRGAYHFDPFSGHRSLPSGHTTAAFALVTPWVYYYPHPATYGLFALSAGTAAARVALDAHWPTDVLAGAAIGWFTARYLSLRHLDVSPPGSTLSLDPVATPEAVGFALRLHI